MNRTMLVPFLLAAATALGAQEPPVPPTRPAQRPAPAARPVQPTTPTPPAAAAPRWEPLGRFEMDLAREQALEATRANREAMRIDMEMAREAAAVARDVQRIEIDRARVMAEADFAQRPAFAPMASNIVHGFAVTSPAPLAAPMAFDVGFRSEDRMPRPVFQQGEPEDSVYRLAHEVLNRGDYGRAAQMFRDIAQKYPKSVYSNDLPYYEAWARYRIGTTDELRSAAKLLEPRASKLTAVSSSNGNMVYVSQRRSASDGDVATLYTRINAALASRGDRDAADRVAKLAQAGVSTCDREDMQVRIEAMSALAQMDPTSALPILRRVLEKKDDCTEALRSRAIFILGSRRGDGEAANLISAAAKSDPSRSVRVEAINWLPKLQGDAGVATLEDLLRTESDESIQRAVVRTLQSSDNPKARSSMRALIDRKDAPINLRLEAISSFSSDRATTDDAAYLRGLYARAENDRMKDAIIGAVARMGGQENEQWVLNIARNPNESSQAKASAIQRLIRSNMAITEFVKLYDVADSYNVRSQVISVLGSRKEPEATDKLIDIVRNNVAETRIRTQAINALSRKNDPRSAQLLVELLDGKSGKP